MTSEPYEWLRVAEAQALYRTTVNTDLLSIRDRAIVLLAFGTGLSRQHLVSLGAAPTSIGNVVYLPCPTLEARRLSRAPAVLPLHTNLWERLQNYRWNAHNQLCTAPKTVKKPGSLLRSLSQPSAMNEGRTVGAALSPDGLYKALLKRAEQAQIKNFKPHRIRHTFVFWCRTAKVPKKFVDIACGRRVARDQLEALDAVTATWNTIRTNLIPLEDQGTSNP